MEFIVFNDSSNLKIIDSTLFLSYATADSNKFKIASIANKLECIPEVTEVLFWEEDMDNDIIEYMNQNIELYDVFILFCSQHALILIPSRWNGKLL